MNAGHAPYTMADGEPEYPYDLAESAISLTFGDVAENGPGMEKLGSQAAAGLGWPELLRAKKAFESAGFGCELLDLVAAGKVEECGGPDGPAPAWLLIVRGGASALLGPGGAGALLAEQAGLPARGAPPDMKAIFRGVVKNKRARHNLCFSDTGQEPSYAEGKGRVVPFPAVPALAAVRAVLPGYFGPKARNLRCEGNYYYNPAKCGIGFHGDAERRIVIAIRLGVERPLHFQWYHRDKPIGERIRLKLASGDLYAMSEKAVGQDWRRPSIPTLRHAAGGPSFL